MITAAALERRLGPALVAANPVLALRTIAAELLATNAADFGSLRDVLSRSGLAIPRAAVQRLVADGLLPPGHPNVEPPPSVLGLAVAGELAVVVPLAADVDVAWSASPALPFTGEDVRSLVEAIAAALDLPGVLPERLAYRIIAPVTRPVEGPSMDVAAALAVLGSAHGTLPLLRAACATVQRDGDRLVAVAAAGAKLGAVVRERGRGSLLVRSPDLHGHDDRFDEVWVVSTIADLANKLAQTPLFGVLAPRSLDRAAVENVLSRVRLHSEAGRTVQALELVERASRVPPGRDVPAALALELRAQKREQLRHLGLFREAEEASARVSAELEQRGDGASEPEHVEARVKQAAAWFDAHAFDRIVECLRPLEQEIERRARAFPVMHRVMVWNTLARAMAVLRDARFADLLACSARLQAAHDPGELPRTLNYLAHGCLRLGWVGRAAEAVSRAGEALGDRRDPAALTSRRFLAFLQADLARREQRQHVDPALEEGWQRRDDAYVEGFYLVATARQPGRSSADRADRLRRAIDCFSGPAGSVLTLLARSAALGLAVEEGDRGSWEAAKRALAGFVERAPDLAAYYGPTLAQMPSTPDLRAVEVWLERVPYL